MNVRMESMLAAGADTTARGETAMVCLRGMTVANPRRALESVGAIWSLLCAIAGHTPSSNVHTTPPKASENDLPIHKASTACHKTTWMRGQLQFVVRQYSVNFSVNIRLRIGSMPFPRALKRTDSYLGRVIAPSDAEETSAPYLPKTPVA